MGYIYALLEPSTLEPRYIGQTINPDSRIHSHVKAARNPRLPIEHWIHKLVKDNEFPRVHLLMEVPDENLNDAEIAMIAYHRAIGCRLLNLTEGGYGSSGYTWTEEQKERFKNGWATERWNDPEYVEAWQKSFENRDKSYLDDSGFIENLSLKAKARWQDPKIRQKYLDSFNKRELDIEALRERSRAIWENEELRAEQSRRTIALFQDEEWRAMHADATRAGMTEEVREHIRQKALERGQDLEYRAAVSASVAQLWDNPEYRANHERWWEEFRQSDEYQEWIEGQRAKSNELWQDVEFVAKQRAADEIRSAKMKEMWAERRDEFLAARVQSDIEWVAKRLGVTTYTVQDYCQKGLLGRKIRGKWVIEEHEVEALLKTPPRKPGGNTEEALARWANPEYRAKQAAARQRIKERGISRKSSDLWKAAEYLGKNYGQVKRLCQNGDLGHKEGNRWIITDEELEAFIRSRAHEVEF